MYAGGRCYGPAAVFVKPVVVFVFWWTIVYTGGRFCEPVVAVFYEPLVAVFVHRWPFVCIRGGRLRESHVSFL